MRSSGCGPPRCPEVLRGLTEEVWRALSPLEIDTGIYVRARDGYRQHTGLIRFSWHERRGRMPRLTALAVTRRERRNSLRVGSRGLKQPSVGRGRLGTLRGRGTPLRRGRARGQWRAALGAR